MEYNIEEILKMYEDDFNPDPRPMDQEPRNNYFGGGKVLQLLKNFNKTGAVKGLEEKLIKQYQSEGMGFIEAIKKAQTEANGVRYEGRMKIIDNAMKETNVMSDDYVDLLDMKIKLEDPDFAKQYVNFSENLKNKTRSRYDSDWAEANFGEEYGTKLDQARVREINESIDPNITERSVVDDIDDMNIANTDEFFGRKKNATGGLQRNMAQGGRIGFYKGRLVKLGPNTGKWAVSYKIKGKSATEYFPDEEAANKFINEQPGSGGARKGSGQKFKAGKKITFTPAEVKKINDSLPNGITLQNLNGYFNWNVGKSAGPDVPKLQRTVAVTNKDIFKDAGLNAIKDDYNNFIEEYLPNRITEQKYQQLRYLDDNINLTLQEFAEKLNNEGYTSMSAGEPLNSNMIAKYDKKAGVVKNKQYSLAESEKLIANSLDPSELEAIKKLNLTTKERETFIRKKANSIRSNDRKLAESGSFANTNSREAKLFNNFYSSYSKNTRMQIGGNFEGKDLSNRENWPKHSDGRINWNARGKNGEPAWKSVVFTDTQVPDKANPGKFKKVKLSFNDLESQVDNAFGEGYFKKSTQAYMDQKQAYKTEGGQEITRKNIIETYKKKYNGAIPEEGYIQKRMSTYSPSQVHHFGEGGVGANPYDVQLTSRSANQALENVEKRHRVSIKNAAGDVNKITEANNLFKSQVNKISKEMGGIKTIIGGEIVGGEATVKSAYNFERKINILNAFCDRKGFAGAGPVGVVTCSMDEIQGNLNKQVKAAEKSIKASKDGKLPKRFGKLRALGKMVFGFGEIPLEGLLTLPELLAGNPDAAVRKSFIAMAIPDDVIELFSGVRDGGKFNLEELKETNPETYQYLKDKKDKENFTKAEATLDELQPFLMKAYDNGTLDKIDPDILKRYNDALEERESILKGYQEYGYYSDDQTKTPLTGKIATKEYLRNKVKTDYENRKRRVDINDMTTQELKDLTNFKYLKKDPNIKYEDKYKAPTDLKSFINQKGELGEDTIFQYGVRNEASNIGESDIFDKYVGDYAGVETPGIGPIKYKKDGKDKYYTRYGITDVRDAFSSLPKDYAGQLAALEKRRINTRFKKKRCV